MYTIKKHKRKQKTSKKNMDASKNREVNAHVKQKTPLQSQNPHVTRVLRAVTVIRHLHFSVLAHSAPRSRLRRISRIYVSQLMSRWRRLDCIFWASRRSCRRPWPADWCLCGLEGVALPTHEGTTWTLLTHRLSALAARLGFGFGFCFGLRWESFWTKGWIQMSV